MQENRCYGQIDAQQINRVKMRKGQNIAGFPIGIIYIEDVYYPMLPGNIVNGYTFPFPVRLKAVEGLTIPDLFEAKEGVFDLILAACKELEREGCRAISSACGFFGNYQDRIAAQIDLPVAISSLVQLPWIETILKPDQKIGVLTADQSSLSKKLLASCNISEALQDKLIIKDLRNELEFSCILESRGEFDNEVVCAEVVSKAMEILAEDPKTGAILLECSDMPPYAYAVAANTGLPVFDFTTLIKWMQNAVCQTKYHGFI